MQDSAVQKNPVLIIVAGFGGVVNSAIALFIAFGVDLSKEQSAAILGFVGVVTALVTAVIATLHTTPFDPTVGNTPEAMAVLRAYETQTKSEKQEFDTAVAVQQAIQVAVTPPPPGVDPQDRPESAPAPEPPVPEAPKARPRTRRPRS